MKKRLFLTSALVLLVSCGDSDEKKSKKKVDRANEKIQRLNTISSELATYDVTLAYSYTDQSTYIEGLDYDSCVEVKNLLAEYESKGNSVLSTSNDSDVYFSDSYTLTSYVSNASTINANTDCDATSLAGDSSYDGDSFESQPGETDGEHIMRLTMEVTSDLMIIGTSPEENQDLVDLNLAKMNKVEEIVNSPYSNIDKYSDAYTQLMTGINDIKASLMEYKLTEEEIAQKKAERENETFDQKIGHIVFEAGSLNMKSIANNDSEPTLLKEALTKLKTAETMLDDPRSELTPADKEQFLKGISDMRQSIYSRVDVSSTATKPYAEEPGEIDGMDLFNFGEQNV